MSRQQKVVVRTTSVPRGWAPGVEPRSVHGGYQLIFGGPVVVYYPCTEKVVNEQVASRSWA